MWRVVQGMMPRVLHLHSLAKWSTGHVVPLVRVELEMLRVRKWARRTTIVHRLMIRLSPVWGRMGRLGVSRYRRWRQGGMSGWGVGCSFRSSMRLIVWLNGMMRHRKVAVLILIAVKSRMGVVSVRRAKRIGLMGWIRISLGMRRGQRKRSTEGCPGWIGRGRRIRPRWRRTRRENGS